MKYQFCSVPAWMPAEEEEAVNRFCAEHRVVSVDKHLIQDRERSYWAFCMYYLAKQAGSLSTRKSRVDYREVLSNEEFALFAKLRDLRKTLAEQEGAPVYAIFTNEHLEMGAGP
jgi:superfamily II DNA helicase RecQ